MCFFASMYPRQVKMSNVYLNLFCLNFRFGEKLDIKIWLYCFQFPRVQILLFVGWKSTRVKRRKVKASEKFCSQFVVVLSTSRKMATTIQRRRISAKEDVFRNRRAPSPTLKISCTRKLWPRRPTRGPFFTPLHTRLQIVYKKFLFVFVCFVSLVFFWSRELNFRQNNAKIQMKRKQNKN